MSYLSLNISYLWFYYALKNSNSKKKIPILIFHWQFIEIKLIFVYWIYKCCKVAEFTFWLPYFFWMFYRIFNTHTHTHTHTHKPHLNNFFLYVLNTLIPSPPPHHPVYYSIDSPVKCHIVREDILPMFLTWYLNDVYIKMLKTDWVAILHWTSLVSSLVSGVKNPPVKVGYVGSIPGLGRSQQPIPIFLHGKFHGQRSLVGYIPQGHMESDTT